MQLKAERYRSRFRILLPRLALRWWLVAPDALKKTGANYPPQRPTSRPRRNREESPTSARNSAVKTTPMLGKLLTISASEFVASSSSRRRSSSAILPLVLSLSAASADYLAWATDRLFVHRRRLRRDLRLRDLHDAR
jgi:hypothetical protein